MRRSTPDRLRAIILVRPSASEESFTVPAATVSFLVTVTVR